MKHLRSLATSLIIGAAMSAPLQADEITDQIEAASKSYADGELRAAVQGLQFAVAGIQEKINLKLLELLPEPLEGWNADEPQATSTGMVSVIAGTNLSRRYYREDGASVEIGITADSPFLAMMTMMLSNPMMMQTDPGTRIYTHEGRRGMIKREPASKHWEISLMAGGNVLIQVSGDSTDKETVEAYLKAIDIGAVEKSFSG